MIFVTKHLTNKLTNKIHGPYYINIYINITPDQPQQAADMLVDLPKVETETLNAEARWAGGFYPRRDALNSRQAGRQAEVRLKTIFSDFQHPKLKIGVPS